MSDSNVYDKNNSVLIYIWSILFIIIVNILSFTIEQDEMYIYIIYFFLAIPYYRQIEKFALITYIFSTIAFFFAGADEAFFSLYTIFCIVALLSIITNVRKIGFRNLWRLLLMVIPVCLSYLHSRFGYTAGMFLLIYNIAIACTYASIINFDRDSDSLKTFFPFIASIQIIIYAIAMIYLWISSGIVGTIQSNINHNVVGISCVQLGVILAVKAFTSEKGTNVYYKILTYLAFILIFFTGSRNALLALVITFTIILVHSQAQSCKKDIIIGWLRFALTGLIMILAVYGLLWIVGFDFTRYDYYELIESGGTNRVYIWTMLIPVIFTEYNIFGYGPSHNCSSIIVTELVGRKYANTHNTFLEAWGELGCIGLIPFLLLVYQVYHRSKELVCINEQYYVFYALLIATFINSMGESVFANIMMWILFSFVLSANKKCISSKKRCDRTTNE